MTRHAPPSPPFRVEVVDFAAALDDLRLVRDEVFVGEQQVPIALEHDALDPDCTHVLARLPDGTAIGTARLTPARHIGRMAVRAPWRGHGVGDALLLALVDAARARGWADVHLNAQVSAIGFYARHGFEPRGPRFVEAGIEHQAMSRALHGTQRITTPDEAIAIATRIVLGARRGVWIRSHALDPGLLDAPDLLDALRRFAARGRGLNGIHVLLHDAAAPQRAHAPLLALAQRLPSAFLFRELEDPMDRADPAAYITSDGGGYYLRPQGRIDGEADLHAPGRARQLRRAHGEEWDRARPVGEYRRLGI